MNLANILHLARHWGAIVLLDEADVFLEQRSHENVNRNALVSVFLRQLEYFQGAMFLTTNRVRTFDEAFQSRIHFALRYEKLGEPARAKVWTEFLKRSGPNSLSPKNLKSLTEKDLNGRQVGLR
jgi:SpoVK/Ycf46/Vps4 family AAA+-type ATPase